MALGRVSVTVDDEHHRTIDQIADQLRERGMQIDQVLVSLGIVIGSVDDPDVLRDVPGVLHVDREETMDVAPPDREIQ